MELRNAWRVVPLCATWSFGFTCPSPWGCISLNPLLTSHHDFTILEHRCEGKWAEAEANFLSLVKIQHMCIVTECSDLNWHASKAYHRYVMWYRAIEKYLTESRLQSWLHFTYTLHTLLSRKCVWMLPNYRWPTINPGPECILCRHRWRTEAAAVTSLMCCFN